MPNKNAERHMSTKNMLRLFVKKRKERLEERRGEEEDGAGMEEEGMGGCIKGSLVLLRSPLSLWNVKTENSPQFEPLLRQDTSMFSRWI